MLGHDWVNLDRDKLRLAFDQWLQEIAVMGYWSEVNSNGQCIHWTSFQAACDDKCKKPHAERPGCYLFGWDSGYENVRLRYVGCTATQSLKTRLSNRYVPGKRSKPDNAIIKQFPLAVHLAENNNDWRGLPDHTLVTHFNHTGKNHIRAEIKRRKRLGQAEGEIAKYLRKHAEPTLRIRHATDFAGYIAKDGIDKMWIALIPMGHGEQVRIKQLEQAVIDVVSRWNEAHQHPILLNDEFPSPWH